MSPVVLAILRRGLAGESSVAPLLEYAAEEVRTYDDHRTKHPFSELVPVRIEFDLQDSSARIEVMARLRAAWETSGQILALSDTDAGLNVIVEALCSFRPTLLSLSSDTTRPGIDRARAEGLPVLCEGVTPDTPEPTVDERDRGTAERLSDAIVSVHLNVLADQFSPATAAREPALEGAPVSGPGWSTRELIRRLHATVPRRGLVELSGYEPARDRGRLSLLAATAVIQTTVERWTEEP